MCSTVTAFAARWAWNKDGHVDVEYVVDAATADSRAAMGTVDRLCAEYWIVGWRQGRRVFSEADGYMWGERGERPDSVEDGLVKRFETFDIGRYDVGL